MLLTQLMLSRDQHEILHHFIPSFHTINIPSPTNSPTHLSRKTRPPPNLTLTRVPPPTLPQVLPHIHHSRVPQRACHHTIPHTSLGFHQHALHALIRAETIVRADRDTPDTSVGARGEARERDGGVVGADALPVGFGADIGTGDVGRGGIWGARVEGWGSHRSDIGVVLEGGEGVGYGAASEKGEKGQCRREDCGAHHVCFLDVLW